VVAWMDVKAANGTWFPILRDMLWMWENLKLWWIPPKQYPIRGDRYSKTGCGEGTMSWTQEITEGFPELPDGEDLSLVSQIDCEGLSQFLAPTPAEPPVSSGVSEDNTPLTTNGKTE
jgi:hypothetical protein